MQVRISVNVSPGQHQMLSLSSLLPGSPVEVLHTSGFVHLVHLEQEVRNFHGDWARGMLGHCLILRVL